MSPRELAFSVASGGAKVAAERGATVRIPRPAWAYAATPAERVRSSLSPALAVTPLVAGRRFAAASARVGSNSRKLSWSMPAGQVKQQTPGMSQSECPECGAAQAPLTCRERLELLLAWEVDDDALRGQHFLTVASYNLQHPAAFTDEARAGLEDALDGYLDGRLTIADIRRRASRAPRVHRPADEVRTRRRDWPMTIDAVAAPGQPAHAATRVLAWAESIRRSQKSDPLPAGRRTLPPDGIAGQPRETGRTARRDR